MNRDIEKFTYRDGTKWARAEYDCRIFEAQDEDGNDCFSGELIDRLAELEDKLEQGTLIELPCKIGDTVYVLMTRNTTTEVVEGTVVNFRRYRDNTWWVEFSDLWGDITFDDFGKTVFLTESEAQAELERRKSNE